MSTDQEITNGRIKTAGRAAAEWWAVQIDAPIFKAVRGDGPRREREAADMASMMGAILASRHPISDKAGSSFVDILAGKIDKQLSERDWGVSLGVDYGPDLMLAEAAEAAGVHLSRFPWKTHMWVNRDHVTAALGYGARRRLIWSAPDWVRPLCRQHHYDRDMELIQANEVCTKPMYHEDDCGEWQPDPARCGDCGGTYVDHYVKGRERKNHSWKTAP